MNAYICEFVGTSMLIILGDGVVANASLEKSNMKGAGPVQITMAWGFAVMIPAFIFGTASGAHFNPALTFALALDGSFAWNMVPGYVVAQFLGAFCGAVVVWAMFKNQLDVTEDPGIKLGCFCTRPAVFNIPSNIFAEVVGTFILVFSIKGIGQVSGIAHGLSNIFIWAIICGIGMSLGGLTGYAINPARDIGPRFAHTILPIKGKGSSHWEYAIVPIVGPLIGGVVGVGLYYLIFA